MDCERLYIDHYRYDAPKVGAKAMIESLAQPSSIPVDATSTLGAPPSRRPSRRSLGGGPIYSVGDDVIEVPDRSESDVAGSKLVEKLLSAEKRLRFLLALPPDWDSYGAMPIDRRNAVTALELLVTLIAGDVPMPSIVPMVDGGIQLEWHRCGVDLEVSSVSGVFEIFFEDRATGEVREGKIGTDLTPLRSFLDRVSCK